MKNVNKVCAILGMFLLLTISAQASESIQTISTITVQGTSTLEVLPDQAIVSIGVINSADTVQEAQSTNATIANTVQQKLAAAGISKDKVSTTQYSISPIYINAEDAGKPQTIASYQVNNTITVTLDDITAIGSVIDAATVAGANQISGIRFQKKAELAVKQTVLEHAVQEATAKAEAIAKALNKRIIRVISVNENELSIQSSRTARYEMSLKAAGTTPIEPGSMQVHGTVSIVFEIQ